MRDLQRECIQLWYFLYEGTDGYVVDSNGYKTPEKKLKYSQPVGIKLPVSARNGSADYQFFGATQNYSRVIRTTKKLPFDEQTLIILERELSDTCYDVYADGASIDGGDFTFAETTSYDGGDFTFSETTDYDGGSLNMVYDWRKADYKVTSVVKEKNQYVYALQKVNVNA